MTKRIGLIIVFLIIAILLLIGLIYVQSNQSSSSNSSTSGSSRQSDSSTNSDDRPLPTDSISKDEAEQVALDEFGGEIKETESDDYNGQPAWEVEIRNSDEHGRIEVKVDKSSGKILNWERD